MQTFSRTQEADIRDHATRYTLEKTARLLQIDVDRLRGWSEHHGVEFRPAAEPRTEPLTPAARQIREVASQRSAFAAQPAPTPRPLPPQPAKSPERPANGAPARIDRAAPPAAVSAPPEPAAELRDVRLRNFAISTDIPLPFWPDLETMPEGGSFFIPGPLSDDERASLDGRIAEIQDETAKRFYIRDRREDGRSGIRVWRTADHVPKKK